MDAVELEYPVDVPKFIGSDGFGRASVTVNEVVACESNTRGVSIIAKSSIERCSTFLRQKDATSTVNGSESTWDEIQATEIRKHDNQLPNRLVRDSSEQLKNRSPSCPSTSRSEVQRKPGKMFRSSSGCSKRPRMTQSEDNMSSTRVDDIKDISVNVEPYPTTKCNPLGAYGLKSDIDEITKHVDDLLLRDLLDGTYKCPSLGNDKGKKATNVNENFVQSVRKACSILPLAKTPLSQNFTEMDSCTNKKPVVCTPNSISSVSGGVNVDKGDSCTPNLSSCNKKCCDKPGTAANLYFPLYQPKVILEKLALPPPKNLEALLLDAAKPSASSRNNSDVRSGKHISSRASLPPFPWSHTYNGNCRTNSDAVKLLTSRSTCQGQWARIDSSATLGASTDCFTNLELLTYDQSLVPPSTSGSTPWCEWGSPSIDTGFKSSLLNPAGHCPRVVAAAQTLCDMAAPSLRQKPIWPKKPCQKAMKAGKPKSFEKPEVFITQFSKSASGNLVRRGINQITPLKRPKLSTMENKKNPSHTSTVVSEKD
ncbi:uncharacterized protein LOC123204127 isoform X2 [Mangifera indica]|uniref:uncharacterized protein LOC123204127 isoform X2 n=1 Tax=Mangifera indica TaxID=29780 RepID=UPI001CFBD1DD|nr:uncharacterized protein LOC123204127 isoform X2 [Mangifera indica]